LRGHQRNNASQALSKSFDFAGGVTVSGSDNQPATCESFSLFTSKQQRETQGGRLAHCSLTTDHCPLPTPSRWYDSSKKEVNHTSPMV